MATNANTAPARTSGATAPPGRVVYSSAERAAVVAAWAAWCVEQGHGQYAGLLAATVSDREV